MKPSSLLTIAQNPEKTIWDTTTNNYEISKTPSLFLSEEALILKKPSNEVIPIIQDETILIKIIGIDFEDKVYQTLVEDNLLKKEKSIILPISNVILNLKKYIQDIKQEIKDFRKSEDVRLDSISIE